MVIALTDGKARQIAGIVGGLTYIPKALPTNESILEDLVLDPNVEKDEISLNAE